MPAVYMLKAKTLWYVTFVVFFICIGCCCFQMCICQQMDQLLIKICLSTPSDGCGCFGTDKVYCTLLRCAWKSLGYPLKEIKNPLGISLVFLPDLNWSGRKTRLDLAGSDRDSVRNSIQGICTDLLTVNWEIWSIICNKTLHPPPSQQSSVPVGFILADWKFVYLSITYCLLMSEWDLF